MYSDDSFFAIQKKAAALQKRALAKKKRESEARPDVRPQATPTHDISIFESLDRLDNDINLSKKDLDEYTYRHGNTTGPIPTLHQISPLSRRILSELKKVNFSDVPESQLRELNVMIRKIVNSWNQFRPSMAELNRKRGIGNAKYNPYRRLYEISKNDLKELTDYIWMNSKDVKGHSYLSGSGIPKRFL